MTKLIEADMHIHTTASDGEYSSLEIYQKIKDTKQIKTFAITDHDTVKGAKELQEHLQNNPDKNITFIPGMEASASIARPQFKAQKSRLHILCYDFDLNHPLIEKLTTKRKQIDIQSIERQLHILDTEENISFDNKEIEAIYEKNNFGRVDIAKLLMKYRIVKNVDEAFDKYLVETHEKVRDTLPKIHEEEVFHAIKQAGGYISLAHPTSLRLDLEILKEYIEYLKSIGLDAIEVYHSHQKRKYSHKLLKIAQELELYVSGGSDYHGPTVKPKVHIGVNQGKSPQKVLTLKDHIIKK